MSYQLMTLKMKIVFLGTKYVTLQYKLVQCVLFKSCNIFSICIKCNRALSRVSVYPLQECPSICSHLQFLALYWQVEQFFLTFCVSKGTEVAIQPISVLLQFAPLSTHFLDQGSRLKQAEQDKHLQIPITVQSWKGGLPAAFDTSCCNAALSFHSDFHGARSHMAIPLIVQFSIARLHNPTARHSGTIHELVKMKTAPSSMQCY